MPNVTSTKKLHSLQEKLKDLCAMINSVSPRRKLIHETDKTILYLVEESCESNIRLISILEEMSYQLWIESNSSFITEDVAMGDDPDSGMTWEDEFQNRFTSPARPLLHCAREYNCCRCQNHCTRCVRSGDPSVSASGAYETEHHTLTECRDVTCTPCCRLPHNNCSTQEEDCYVHPETNIIVPYTADFSFANDSIYFSDDSVSSCNGPLDLSISSIGTSVRWCNESACSDGYRGCSEFEGDMSNDNSLVSEADMASDSCPLSEEVSITNTENEQPTRIEDVPASEIVSMLKIVSTRDSETQTEEHMTLLAHCSSDKVVFKSTVRKRRQKKYKRLKRDVFNDDARVDSMIRDVKQFITSPMEYVRQLLILGALNLVSLFFR